MKLINVTAIKKHKFVMTFVTLFIVIILVSGQSPVPKNSVAVKIAGGFSFVEGPVWIDGVGLLFSDIPENTIYRWTPGSGVSVYLTPSGNSNGLALDAEGRLILAQHGKRRVARIEHNGSETDLASTYNGKKLNSPNDIAIKSDGSIFFTDPPYGISAPEEELGFRGIFRISPAGDLQLLDSSLEYPNGIAFAPDETKLYVGHSDEMTVYVWDVVDDTTITNKQVFARMPASCCTDGMKVGTAGNLFSTGPIGVWVYSPDGTVLDTIPVPGQTTNCCFGNADRKTLYITSGDAIYRIHVETGGITNN
jgi:gluconolactonase